MSTTIHANPLPTQPQRQPKPNRWLRWLRYGVGGLLGLLIALAGVGALYQIIATAQDRRTLPPPGQLVDVSGYKLHLYSMGENQGNPTVVLLSCGGCMTPNWGWIQPELAKFTRVVAYDRAGFGWSEPAATPRTAEQAIAELRIALKKAAIPGPYLLVGHSLGGLLARIYATRYPEEVVGLVLLDPRHPDQTSRWPAAARTAEAGEANMLRLLGWLARLGVLRLTSIGYEQARDLPPQQAAQYAALWATTQFWQSIQTQGAMVTQLDTEARATNTLGDLPLIVISATTAWLTPGAPADEARQVYTALNLEQAALSSNSLHRSVEGTSHTSLVNKQADAQATVDAVRQLLAAIATGKPLKP